MISNPIKGYKNLKYPKGNVTQWVGENVDLYSALNVGLTKGHNGIDIVAPWGTPIFAVEGGIVCETKTNPSGYGMHVRILTEGTGIQHEWTYGHLSRVDCNIGDKIKVGQQIGLMGNTGFVVSSLSKDALGYWDSGGNNYNGTHLHLGCREFKYDKRGWAYYPNLPKITVLNYENGLLGSIDFKDMFYTDTVMGDIEILKRELEKTPNEEWWMVLIRALKFFSK